MKLDEQTNKFIDQQALIYEKRFRGMDGKVFVFGAGIKGRPLAKTLIHYHLFAGFIDNDIKKQKNKIMGFPVICFTKFKQIEGEKYIIIACSEKNRKFIEKQLDNAGLVNEKNYLYVDDLLDNVLPVYALYQHNESFVSMAQISLTENCTLKCKNCAHACYNVRASGQELSLEDACESADYFFSHVDYTNEFTLIGGEPFLYQQLDKIIDYIGSKYRDQISDFAITSNGTIVPRNEILNACVRHNIRVNISDYSKSLERLVPRYDRLKYELKNFGVDHCFIPMEGMWTDYGIGKINRKLQKKDLIHVFDGCKTPCREIRKSRLYFCVMARSASENLDLHIGEDDYLELALLKNTDTDKKKLLQFQLGYLEKGYLEMCNHCYGGDRFNHPVPVAEQMN